LTVSSSFLISVFEQTPVDVSKMEKAIKIKINFGSSGLLIFISVFSLQNQDNAIRP
jgi:hypothetical protein